MRSRPGGSRVFALVLLVSLGAVGAALVSQHVFDIQPCPWCVLQRLIFVALALAALLGLLWRSPSSRRVAAAIGIVLAGLGVAAAMWQHVVAAKSASCNLTLADRIVSGLQLDALLPRCSRPRRRAPMPRCSCSACLTSTGAWGCSAPSASH